METPKQIFESMLLEEAAVKYPNVPPHALVKKEYKLRSANGLAGAIVHFIKLLGGHAERRSNTGRYIQPKTYTNVFGKKIELGKGKYIPGTGRNGTSDVSGVFNGVPLAIEVKIGKDRMSEAQKQYKRDFEKAGGFYMEAKTFDQFYKDFKERF